jgi:hypothetical protein
LDVVTADKNCGVELAAVLASSAHPVQVILAVLLQPKDDFDSHALPIEGLDTLVEPLVQSAIQRSAFSPRPSGRLRAFCIAT